VKKGCGRVGKKHTVLQGEFQTRESIENHFDCPSFELRLPVDFALFEIPDSLLRIAVKPWFVPLGCLGKSFGSSPIKARSKNRKLFP
jgi:hypothetical protein